MTLQLNVGDEFLGAVFTHEFLVPDVLPDVSSQSFQLLVRLGAPLTSEKQTHLQIRDPKIYSNLR